MKNLFLYFFSFIIFIVSFYFLLSLYNQRIIQKFISQKGIYSMDKDKFPLSQYNKEFLFKVGRVEDSTTRKNYFLQFPQDKKKGVIRIGAFGDSFTYGDEVEKGWSYPAQLQMIFNEHFPEKKVEVLNFGMGAHGLQQHFLVWKEYAKKYNIDYVLLGPEGAQPDRDPAFTPPWNNQHYLKPPRGRYILRKDGLLDFINIDGNTFLERYKNYYTLSPSWAILKYDKYFFNFWKRTYFPFVKKKIKNPFYYSNLSTEEETAIINRILLKQMIKNHPKKIVFLAANHDVYNLYKKDKKSLNLNHLHPLESNLLYSRVGHYSTLGYELWAKIFFKALTGQNDFTVKTFKCLKQQENTSIATTEKLKKTELLKEISIYYKEVQIAELNNPPSFEEARSFITFFNPSESFLEGIYQPVPFQLSKKNKIFIKNGYKKFLLGPIFPIDKKKLFFGFQKDYILGNGWDSSTNRPVSLLLLDKIFSENINDVLLYSKPIELYVDSYKVAVLKIDKESPHTYRITPPKEITFFGTLSHSIQHKNLPEKMNLSFKYIYKNNEVIDSPVLNFPCVKSRKKIHIDISNLNAL